MNTHDTQSINPANDAVLARIDETNIAPAPTTPLVLIARAMRGRVMLGLVVGTLLGLVAAPVGFYATKPSFESTGIVRVAQTAPKILYQSDENQTQPLFDSFVQAQADLILTRPVLERASADRGLRAAAWPDGTEGVLRLAQSLKVDRKSKSELILITARDADPQAATHAVNAVLDAFQDLYGERADQNISIKERTLMERERQMTDKIEAIEQQLLAVGAEHGIETLARAHGNKVEQIQQLDQKLSDLDSSIAQQESSGATSTMDSGDGGIVRLTVLDHAMATLINERTNIATTLAALEEHFGAGHRAVIEQRRKLAVQDEAIEARRTQLTTLGKTGVLTQSASGGGDAPKTATQLKDLRARMADIRKVAKTEAVELHRKLVSMQTLQGESARLRRTLDETRRGLEQIRLESQNTLPGRIAISARGSLPLRPAKDRQIMLAGAGGAGAFVMGFVLVIAAGLAQQKYRFSDELDGVVSNHPLIGVVPENAIAEINDEPAAIHHARNALQLQFLRNPQDRPVLAVTGTTNDARRTFSALSLARSFADSGVRTVLIDADLTLATLSADLGLTQQPGLREALQGENAADLLVQHTRRNLSILPVGQTIGMEGRHLSPRNLAAILEKLLTEFEAVIIDAGPINRSIEAGIVIGLADHTLLTIDADESRAAVQRTLESLDRVAPRRVSTIFNGAKQNDPGLTRHAA